MIQRPKGEALLFKNDTWYALFYEDGKRKRKSLSTNDYNVATLRRDLFFHDSELKPRKECDKEDRYIYKRLPYYVKIGKKLIGQYKTKGEARIARDANL